MTRRRDLWPPSVLGLLQAFAGLRADATRAVSHSSVYLCCRNVHLRFGLLPIAAPPYWGFDPDTWTWSGYTPLIIDELAKEMGFSYSIVPYPNVGAVWPHEADYNVTAIHTAMDVAVVDLTADGAQSLDRVAELAYTNAWFSSSYMGLVLKTKSDVSLWALFEPFTSGLWGAIVVSVFTASILMVVLSALVDGPSALTVDSASKAVYHSWAAMLGGEDYEWVNWPGRFLRLGILFLVLLSGSTYTANLAAFFTKPAYTIHGPTDMATLRDAVVCVESQDQVKRLAPFCKSVIYPDLDWGDIHATRQWCHRAVTERRADVWFADYAGQNAYLLDNCDSLSIVRNIALSPVRVGFSLLAAEHMDLAANMSTAIVHIEQQPVYQSLAQEMFRWGRACPANDASDTAQVSFESMGGLFIIYGIFCAVALLLAIAQTIHRRFRRPGVADDDGIDHTATEGEMLRALLRKVDALTSDRIPSLKEHASGMP